MNKDNTGDLFFQQVMEYELESKKQDKDEDEEKSKDWLATLTYPNSCRNRTVQDIAAARMQVQRRWRRENQTSHQVQAQDCQSAAWEHATETGIDLCRD